MSLFTSSFKPLRSRALQAAFIALVGMIALEAFSRIVLLQSSKDFKRFSSYKDVSRQLMAADARRVIFIGNSYTAEGIDEEQFGRLLTDSAGTPAAAAKLTADSSYATT